MMAKKQIKFSFKGKTFLYPGQNAWTFVGVPKEIANKIAKGAAKIGWGMVPITAKIGKTSWKTSLLPAGEGKYLIALKAQVRKAEGIFEGDTVTVEVSR